MTHHRDTTDASTDDRKRQPWPGDVAPAPAPTRRQFVRSVGAGALAASVASAGSTPVGAQATSRPFVQTDGTDLVLDGETVYFHGANNFWITDSYRGTQERIDDLFGTFEEMGIDLLRTFVACEGGDGDCYIPEPYEHSEGAFETLDYLIAAAADHDIRLVLVLADNWDHNGGADQYVDWIDGAEHHGDFYANEDCRDLYRWHVEETLTRENTITGLEYREDPTIAFWELCNEPRIEGDAFGEGEDPGYEERASILEDWLREMAGFVSDLDSNHLISTGMEGFYTRDDRTEWFYSDWTGQDFLRHHAIDDVDVATFHWYPDHWDLPLEYGATWIAEHVRDAHEELGKPAYLGEFNVNADNGLDARNEHLADWYAVADAYDCDAATLWQIILEEMHDHDGFNVRRSESGDVLAAYRDAVEIKRETAVGGDSETPLQAPNAVHAWTNGSTVDLDWSRVAAASEYVVTLDGTERTRTTATRARLEDLAAEREYEVGVAAVGPGGETTDAATTTVTTVGPGTVDAPAWEYGDVYEDGDTAVHNGVLWEAQWYTDEEEPRFESGYAWEYVDVVGIPGSDGGDGPDPEPPAPPADLWADEVTDATVELAWEPVANATSYDVLLDGDAVDSTAATTYEFDGLDPETEYVLGVRSRNDAGTAAVEELAVETEPGDGPTGPCEGLETVEVDGQTVCNVDGDEYYRDVNGDGNVGNRDVGAFFERFHLDAWDRDEFDYSGNGRVSHGDVVALFDYVL